MPAPKAEHGPWADLATQEQLNAEFARRDVERDAGEKALAEREAQCAQIHLAWSQALGASYAEDASASERITAMRDIMRAVLKPTADASRVFVERVRAEERERACAAICKRCAHQPVFEMKPGEWWHGTRERVEAAGGHSCYASNIRALGPQGEK